MQAKLQIGLWTHIGANMDTLFLLNKPKTRNEKVVVYKIIFNVWNVWIVWAWFSKKELSNQKRLANPSSTCHINVNFI